MGGTRAPSWKGLVLLALAAVLACGARTSLSTRKNATDASAPSAGDASIAGIAGIACAGFDPSWMRSSPVCDALETPMCDAWARAVLPSDYPVGGACDLGPHRCRFRGVFRVLPCEPGVAGDDACRTFASEFVRPGGVPDARCEANTDGLGPIRYACNFRCEVEGSPCAPLTFEEPLRLCVWRDGARRCEKPCE